MENPQQEIAITTNVAIAVLDAIGIQRETSARIVVNTTIMMLVNNATLVKTVVIACHVVTVVQLVMRHAAIVAGNIVMFVMALTMLP